MKIDVDLRMAVRSVVELAQSVNTYERRSEAQDRAIKLLLASPKHSAKAKAAKRAEEKANSLGKAARDFYNSIGLSGDASRIWDDAKFFKAGGKIAPQHKAPSFRQVMSELAQADDKQGRAILKRLGIQWI